jgi:alginate O-acetyltransferase complex protein AlgI
MDAPAFLAQTNDPGPGWENARARIAWAKAGVTTAAGIGFVLLAAKLPSNIHPLIRGRLGMIGIVLFLHFGIFKLLALSWQCLGVDAQPVMNAPFYAKNLAEFWSTRWNTAFNSLAHDLAFRPLVPRIGLQGAALATFAVSGLVHELVISLPARGGFGFPLAYFILQGFGVMLERSRLGKRLGLGRGFRGWCYVCLCAGAPAFWLFHPSFVRKVILPMLSAIGST